MEVRVEDLGHKGDGVARHDDYVIFVPGALPGEVLEVEVTSVGSSFARGRPVHILCSAPARISPPCEVFDRCGGCQLQHLKYSAQLGYKMQWVKQALAKIAGVKATELNDTLPSHSPYAYRTRMRFSLDYEQGPVLGFYQAGGKRVIDVEQCPLQSTRANHLLCCLRRHILQRVTREKTVQIIEQTRDISIRNLGRQCMVVLRLRNNTAQAAAGELADRLWGSAPDYLTSVTLLRDLPSGEPEIVSVRGAERVHWRFAGLQVVTSPSAFTQVNVETARQLYDLILQEAGFLPEDEVIELYSGTGLLTALMAPLVSRIYAVDAEKAAVADAREIARTNGVDDTVSFYPADAAEGFSRLLRRGVSPNIVVLDPPRAGCAGAVRKQLASCAARKIIYVSCNFGTWARDVGELVDAGWSLDSVFPVDMFPQTCNVEIVSFLVRPRSDEKSNDSPLV